MSTGSPEDWNDLTVPAEGEAPHLELPPERKRPQRLLIPALFVLSFAVLAGGWFGPLNPWPPAPDKAELAKGRKAALKLADKAIHDYALRNGEYPARLDDAIVLPADLRLEYVPHATSFELRIADDTL